MNNNFINLVNDIIKYIYNCNEILKEISNKYIIFIEVFVIRLFNIKDKHKLKI